MVGGVVAGMALVMGAAGEMGKPGSGNRFVQVDDTHLVNLSNVTAISNLGKNQDGSFYLDIGLVSKDPFVLNYRTEEDARKAWERLVAATVGAGQ
jgi:hypothetical protein